jgi:hypothetical protein
MNTIKTTLIGMLFGSTILFAACGGLDIGLDDEAQATLDCLTDDSCDDDDSGDTAEAATDDDDAEDSDDAEDTDDSGDSDAADEETHDHTLSGDSYDGSREDDDDTSGGILSDEPNGYEDTDDRYFMGTYENFHDENPDCAYDYNLPNVVRAYSHNTDDFIDFETNTGSLAWIAEQYPDDTFDFSLRFLDAFGDPSISLDCTCTISPAYYDYYNERIGCSCESDDGTCDLGYEKM